MMKKKSEIQIFLAHANVDKRRVVELYYRLKAAGYKPWLDKKDLIPGQNWRDEILKAITNSELFLACLSSESVNKQGYIQREFRIALDTWGEMPPGTIFFIPMRLEKCEIPDLRLSEGGRNLRDIHCLNYWEEDGFEDLERAIAHQFGPFEEIPDQQLDPYLPKRRKLIGRDEDINRLLAHINNSHYPIFLEGFGGVGKTVLSIEAAYCSLDRGLVDDIIFISESDRIKTRIFHIIAERLEAIRTVFPEDQEREAYKVFREKNLLLILDNLESIEEKERQSRFDFIYELQLRNPQTKVVITARDTQNFTIPTQFPNFIRQTLRYLPEDKSIELIQEKAKKPTLLSLTTQQAKTIHNRFFGIPYALIQTISQIKLEIELHPEKSTDEILNNILRPSHSTAESIAEYCAGESIQRLRQIPGDTAHKLLLSIAIFSDPAHRDAIKRVAGLDSNSKVEKGLEQLYRLHLIEVNKEGRYWMLPLTREYIYNKELSYNPNFREAAQERWVKWYKDFAKKYGGKDWEEWYNKYNHLKREWRIFLSVLEWCKKENRYEDIKDLWKYLKDYASIYGYWADRLRWMNWLIDQSVERGEWFTALHCMSSKGWTLVQMWELEKETENLLKNAWELAKFEDLDVQDSLAKHLVYLYIRKRELEEANRWIDKWETEIVKSLDLRRQERLKITGQHGNIDTDKIHICQEDEERIARSKINILYYRGEISFLQNDYSEAEKYFIKVIDEARKHQWTRRINYAQNWLGDISIIKAKNALEQNELDQADKLIQQAQEQLTSGFNAAEVNYDKRRIAYYKCSRAKLEKVWGHWEEKHSNRKEANKHFQKALNSAQKAKEDFDKLGIELQERDLVGIEEIIQELEELEKSRSI